MFPSISQNAIVKQILYTKDQKHYPFKLFLCYFIFQEKQQLRKRVVRCSSLQHCCRYAVRQTVHPFTPSTVESLGLPVQLQEYLLEHPLQKYLDYPESHY
jgi:hypothetical protein